MPRNDRARSRASLRTLGLSGVPYSLWRVGNTLLHAMVIALLQRLQVVQRAVQAIATTKAVANAFAAVAKSH